MFNPSIKHFMIIASMLPLLLFFYFKMSTLAPEDHRQLELKIGAYEKESTLLDARLLETRYGLINHYDDLILSLENIRKLYQEILMYKSVHGSTHSDDLLMLEELYEKKEVMIHYFVADHAIEENSLRFLLLAIEEIVLETEGTSSEIIAFELQSLLNDILEYVRQPDPLLRLHIADDLSNIAVYEADENIIGAFNISFIIKHAHIVLEYNASADRWLKGALAVGLKEHAVAILKDHKMLEEKSLSQANVYRNIMILMLFIMAAYIVMILLRLGEKTMALTKSEERYALVLEGTNAGLWDWDVATDTIYYSPTWKKMLGYEEHEIGNTLGEWFRRLHPHDQDVFSLFKGDDPDYGRDIEFRMRHKDGRWLWIQASTSIVKNRHGDVVRRVGTHRDMTEKQEAELALFQEKERAAITLQSIVDAVVTTDIEGRIEYMNPVAERISEWSMAHAVGKRFAEVFNLVYEDSLISIDDLVADCLKREGPTTDQQHVRLLSRSGHSISIEYSAAPLHSEEGRQISGVVVVVHDVSHARKMAQQLSYQATHDALTGLLNRSEFERRLQRLLDSAKSTSTEHAFCYIDLDQFKVVNDTCGHVAGDELLRQLTTILKAKVREGDTLARLGGDEFAVLLGDCRIDRAQEIAGEFCRLIREFRFSWGENVFEIGASIGLVAITENSENITQLLKDADSACYAAKDAGRNRVYILDETDERVFERTGEMHWVPRITRALQQDRFCIFKQKMQVSDPASGLPGMNEILIRMIKENGDIIAPGSFIPAAERYNLMPQIDRWLVHRFFSHYHDIVEKYGLEDDIWTVNLSGTSINEESFSEFIFEQVSLYDIPAHKICFEITETAVIANLSMAIELMHQLKEMGFSFALDDFGTGLSSFSYLKSLPVDYLKIDGGFIENICDDPIDMEMVRAIKQIGKAMGLSTIAEAVSSANALKILTEMGVDYLQGYWVERPHLIDIDWSSDKAGKIPPVNEQASEKKA